MIIKKMLRPLVRTAVGRAILSRTEQRIRDWMDWGPIWFNAPVAPSHSVSDAFFWRLDAGFRTRFDLMNVPSFATASPATKDRAVLVFFSPEGREIGRERFALEPFEIRPVFIEDYIPSDAEFGTFFSFHELSPEGWPYDTCPLDRGYTSYQAGMGGVWNYVHGCCNTLVLAYDPGQEHYYPLSRRSVRKHLYRPQLNLADCHRFEALISNPLAVNCQIAISTFDRDRQLLARLERDLPGLASAAVEVDNREGLVEMIEVESRLFLCRPLIFKHHDYDFDVLHS